KLAAVRRYGLFKRALTNGVGLLLRGRFDEFLRKLHDGLHWSQTSERVIHRVTPSPRHPVTPSSGHSVIRKLDIVYVLKGAGLCGGVKVVLEHARRLHARGHNASIYYLEGTLDWFKPAVPAVHFSSPDALRAALRHFRGIKVATWHETAPWVADSLRPGDRGYYLIQDIEDCYGTTEEER